MKITVINSAYTKIIFLVMFFILNTLLVNSSYAQTKPDPNF